MEEKRKDILFYEWLYKKGLKVWGWYSAWCDRHPTIVGIFLTLLLFSMAHDSYNRIPTSQYPFMEWFCVFVFVMWCLLFLYLTFIYKPKSDEE